MSFAVDNFADCAKDKTLILRETFENNLLRVKEKMLGKIKMSRDLLIEWVDK
jgi:hypothetical protein